MGRPGSGLLELLVEHGVPERAARVYLAASRGGPQTASELARVSALHRVDTYRYIKQLTADGLLRSTGGRPMRFAALPPDLLFDRWIRHTSARLDHLEQSKDRVLTAWRDGQAGFDDRDPLKFALLEGQTVITRFLERRIGTAEKEILVSVGGFWLARMIDGGIDRALKEAHARGVRIRLVTEVAPPNLSDAKHFASFAELRHAEGPVANRTLVIDRGGVLVFFSGESGLGRTGEEQIAMWSSSPNLVTLAREYHKRLWGPATRAEDRFVEIEVPNSAVLPVIQGREAEPFRRVREMASLGMRATGIRELKLNVPEVIDTVARQLGRQVADEIEGRTLDEVTQSLATYYAAHTMGRLTVIKERPLVVRITGCFACTSDSPEVGRVMCPRLLETVLETRLGTRWKVSKPDPTHHAQRGCLFTLTPA